STAIQLVSTISLHVALPIYTSFGAGRGCPPCRERTQPCAHTGWYPGDVRPHRVCPVFLPAADRSGEGAFLRCCAAVGRALLYVVASGVVGLFCFRTRDHLLPSLRGRPSR